MDDQELRPAIRMRLAYLDQCLRWRGHANRRDLIEKFGISPAQAAIDFSTYIQQCRAPLPVYDRARKTYLASEHHRGLTDSLSPPSPVSVIAEGAGDRFDALPMPHRHCPDAIMRKLYQAMERGVRIQIDYSSMTSGERTTQWIAPARIGFDGERLHFRAWSYLHGEWRDYLPVRISEASSFATEPPPAALPRDEDWETRVRIVLRPRADLSPEQQKAVRLEYGFQEGELVIETREALAFYLDRRWGLSLPGSRLERHSSEKIGPNAEKLN